MRVAFVSARTIHHAETDTTARLDRLAAAVANRGHEVTCYTSKWWQGDFREFEHEGLAYRGIGNGPGEGMGIPLKVANAIRKADPDVVHVVCGDHRWTHGAKWGASLTGAGLLIDWYDPPATTGLLSGWRRNRALKRADYVVTPSQTVETAVRERGVNGRSVRVIPTGIDLERIKSIPAVESGDIVYSRELDEGANLETLLLALAEFREYDWNASIIGDGPRRAQYERQTHDLRIDDRVEFLGALPLEERIARFKHAHVYVHTADYTPFAHDLLRALATGCVSIVEYHEHSSAHELVVHEDRGYTATSPEQLTRRLAAAGDLEGKSFDESFEQFSDEAFLEAYLDLYRSIKPTSNSATIG